MALLCLVGGVVFAAPRVSNYTQVNQLIKEALQFQEEGKYEKALASLVSTTELWTLQVNRNEVEKLKEQQKQYIEDRETFEIASEKMAADEFRGARDLLSVIGKEFPEYKEVELALKEVQIAIENALEEEVQRAEGKAREEASKRLTEEVARREAEQRADSERSAKEQQQRETEIQRQRAEQERLAKEEQQRETDAQRKRAGEEEKAKYIELARTNPLVKAIISGELKFYIEPIPSYAASGVESAINALADDFASWEPYQGIPVRRVYSPDGADIIVRWVRDYGGHTIGEAIFQSYVKVGLGTQNCRGDWRAFDSLTVSKILWHELGHSMGYGHSNNPNNIMYDSMVTRFDVEQEISGIISGGWYEVFLLCGSGTYLYSFEASGTYDGFNLSVLPPHQDAHQFSGGGGSHYPSCGADGMRRYSNKCTVPRGAKIYIENTSSRNTIRLSGKIINIDLPPNPDSQWDSNTFQYSTAELTKIWQLFR